LLASALIVKCLISPSIKAAPVNTNRNGLYIGFYHQFPFVRD
jgi:hypothetical protein